MCTSPAESEVNVIREVLDGLEYGLIHRIQENDNTVHAEERFCNISESAHKECFQSYLTRPFANGSGMSVLSTGIFMRRFERANWKKEGQFYEDLLIYCPQAKFPGKTDLKGELCFASLEELPDTWNKYTSEDLKDAILRRTCNYYISGRYELNTVDIYNILRSISLQAYEGTESRGSIFLSANETPIDIDLKLAESIEIKLTDIAPLRKLLEVTNEENSVFISKGKVLGICNIEGTRKDTGAVIEFQGRYSWRFIENGEDTFICNNGRLTYRGNTKIDNKESKPAKYLFKPVANSEFFIKLSKYLQDQKKGALIAVSKEPDCNRLCPPGIKVEPKGYPAELISRLAIPDGAVALDFEGITHAFCIILDDNQLKEEDLPPSLKPQYERGARFHSALRFVMGSEDRFVILKSEDRDVEYISREGIVKIDFAQD